MRSIRLAVAVGMGFVLPAAALAQTSLSAAPHVLSSQRNFGASVPQSGQSTSLFGTPTGRTIENYYGHHGHHHHHHEHHHGHGFGGYSFGFGFGVPGYGYFGYSRVGPPLGFYGAYAPWYGSAYGYGVDPYYDPYLPPIFGPPNVPTPPPFDHVDPLNVVPDVQQPVHPADRPIEESTPEARLRSLESLRQGDGWFRQHNYVQAYLRYKKAVELADDLAEAHFRLGWTLLAMGRYEQAAFAFRRGVKVDPTWPTTGKSLTEVFGEDDLLRKNSLLYKLANWVREDIRDPDRLFLLGVLLHFDGHPRAHEVFESALRLTSGQGEHLAAFLQPAGDWQTVPQAKPAPGPALRDGEQPSVPDPQLPPPAPEPSPSAPGTVPPVPQIRAPSVSYPGMKEQAGPSLVPPKTGNS